MNLPQTEKAKDRQGRIQQNWTQAFTILLNCFLPDGVSEGQLHHVSNIPMGELFYYRFVGLYRNLAQAIIDMRLKRMSFSAAA